MNNAEEIAETIITLGKLHERGEIDYPLGKATKKVQAHTNATLQELEERVGEYFKNEKHEYRVSDKEIPLSLKNDEEMVLQLIDQLKTENKQL